MYFKQFYLGCLSHASYLIGDTETGTAVVVDPQRDVDHYLAEAETEGLKIRHAILTHFHADFASGHLELRESCGAEIMLGEKADAQYKFRPLRDGETIEFGKVRLKALETPGHTPEAISILVYDLEKDSEKPHAVLTGDTLFNGDVGRPDLMASFGISDRELAGMLYDSLHDKLLTLPDETFVYPAHGAGSMCGKNLGKETCTTIGAQRKFNYALQPMSKDEFIDMVTADQPQAPRYFEHNATYNRLEHETLEQVLEKELRPLSLEEVIELKEEGACVLDVREPADYAAEHFEGSTNVGLSGQFATWSGTLIEKTDPIVIVSEPGRETEAAMRLGRIGFDQVRGFLAGGIRALKNSPELLRTTNRIEADGLRQWLESSNPPPVLDVRTEQEFQQSRIPGSVLIPLNQLQQRIDEVPHGRPLVVHCRSGYRSSIACSILEQNRITDAVDLAGGIMGWEKSQPRNAPSPA